MIRGDEEVVDHVAAIDLGDDLGRARQPPLRPDRGPIEIGLLEAVAEEDHLTGCGIDFRVRAHAERHGPGEIVTPDRVELPGHFIGSSFLGQRQETMGMMDDVDVGQELEAFGVRVRSGELRGWDEGGS